MCTVVKDQSTSSSTRVSQPAVAFMSLSLCPAAGESMLVVDEGSSVCLCGGVLGASDPDSPPDQLIFHLEAPPLHGFLENTLPTPGSEKSNAGVRLGQWCLCVCVWYTPDLTWSFFFCSQNPSVLST